EHCVLRDRPKTGGPEHADVRVRADEHPEVSVEALHPPDRSLRRAPLVARLRGASGARAPARLGHHGPGKELRELLHHAYSAGAGAAAAVRRGEGLVEVEVHDVDAHQAGPGHAENGVEVRTVAVDEAPRLVHETRDLQEIFIKETESVR